jgi:serine/threonine protein phosphatase PrpC
MSKVPIPGQPAITFAEVCDRGIERQENQDSVLHAPIPMGHLLIVADGIGGYSGGAVASALVIDSFHQYLATLPPDYPVDQAIQEASNRANANVIAAANAPGSQYQHMGSTVVMALFQRDESGPRAWVGHIGDSRAYLVRDGRLSKITNDHSAVQALLNRNLITPEQALHHPDSSVLTRSIGHQAQVEPDIELVPLQPGDRVLLCSDGLWGYVAEQEISRVVVDPALPAEPIVNALLQLALDAGGHDNIGIEMAILADPAAQVAPFAQTLLEVPIPARRRFGLLEILALCLFALGALGAVITYAVHHQWFQTPAHPQQTAPAQNPQPKPRVEPPAPKLPQTSKPSQPAAKPATKPAAKAATNATPAANQPPAKEKKPEQPKPLPNSQPVEDTKDHPVKDEGPKP